MTCGLVALEFALRWNALDWLAKLASEACLESVCFAGDYSLQLGLGIIFKWKLMTHLNLCFCIHTFIIPATLTASRSVGSRET